MYESKLVFSTYPKLRLMKQSVFSVYGVIKREPKHVSDPVKTGRKNKRDALYLFQTYGQRTDFSNVISEVLAVKSPQAVGQYQTLQNRPKLAFDQFKTCFKRLIIIIHCVCFLLLFTLAF